MARTAKQKANDKRLGAASKARAAAKKKAAAPRAAAPRKPAAKKASPSRALSRPAPKPAVATAKPRSKAARAKSAARAAASKGIQMGKEVLTDVVVPGVVGGLAASGIDVAYGAAARFLPAVVTQTSAKHFAKGLAGVGLAWGAQKLGVPGKHCKSAAIGMIAVGLNRAVNEQVEKRVEINLNGVGMTVGDLAAVLPADDGLNGLEALGAMATGGANLGAVLPFITQQAA